MRDPFLLPHPARLAPTRKHNDEASETTTGPVSGQRASANTCGGRRVSGSARLPGREDGRPPRPIPHSLSTHEPEAHRERPGPMRENFLGPPGVSNTRMVLSPCTALACGTPTRQSLGSFWDVVAGQNSVESSKRMPKACWLLRN